MLLQKSKIFLCLFLVTLLIFACISLPKESKASGTMNIAEGAYYLRNTQSKSYVDIQNQNMANGTIIHQ